MENIYKISASAIMAALLLTGCSTTNSPMANTKSTMSKNMTVVQIPKGAPVAQPYFRFSDAKNFELTNKDRLANRNFYSQPSTGADAKWFDAVKHGDMATVKYMVDHGQNLEAIDTGSLDQTALGWAAFIGYEDMVDYLVDKGANLYATDKGDAYNALKSATLGTNVRITRKIHGLLDAKSPIDLDDHSAAVDRDGETLIMIAASNDRRENVKYLLSQGVDPNIVATTKDKASYAYNQSAYSYACMRGLVEMQKLLAANGAINHRTGKASCE